MDKISEDSLGAGFDPLFTTDDENFKVVIRVRPPLHRELNDWRPFQNTVQVDSNRCGITISENLPAYQTDRSGVCNGLLYATQRFAFDHIFNESSSQSEVYESAAQPAVVSALQGYNAAIIAYGQTGTGKTYTMEGVHDDPVHQGIVPRAIKDIFRSISADSTPHHQYLVRASYLQIYNEVISDLLKPERSNLVIREDRKRGVYVDKLSEWVVRNEEEILELMARGAQARTTGATKLNDMSSRSHAVFIIIVEQSQGCQQAAAGQDLNQTMSESRQLGMAAAMPDMPVSIKVGKLNLVDLAGSERVHITGATGKRLEESKSINQSLSSLGNVIAALTDRRGRAHIPYRDSKLTRILEDSLGGNCKTTMICMVSPALDAFAESVSTLKFANRAKCIKNRAEVNEDVNHRTLLRKYEQELKKLRTELKTRSQQLVDKRHLLQLDEQRRRAEADKLAAITELENRSQEFMREKCEKMALEEKIASLQGQLLIGGNSAQVNPAIRGMLEKEQRKFRSEYEARFRELERERVAIQDDKAKMQEQRELLLKQRDIMLALTKRLSDRDEQILMLQEELDAYDAAQRQLEDALDQRVAEIFALRKAALQQMKSPGKAEDLQTALGPWGNSVGEGSDKNRTDSDSFRILALRPECSDRGAVEANGNESGASSPSLAASGALQPATTGQESQRSAKDQQRLEELERQRQDLEQQNQWLQEQVEALAKKEKRHKQSLAEEANSFEAERVALKKILENKMRVSVEQILQGIDQLQQDGTRVPSNMSKQVRALHSLIAATVKAIGPAGEI